MKSSVVLHMLSFIHIFLFTIYQSVYILANDKTSNFLKTIAAIALLATIFVGSSRTTYLPFLGSTVLPTSLLKDVSVSDVRAGDIVVKVPINAPDNTRVVYWASNSADVVFDTPSDAYDGFKNSGVALVNRGIATFYIQCPSSYKVPYATLSPHVHYRVSLPNGLLSIVKTVYVDCGKRQ